MILFFRFISHTKKTADVEPSTSTSTTQVNTALSQISNTENVDSIITKKKRKLYDVKYKPSWQHVSQSTKGIQLFYF